MPGSALAVGIIALTATLAIGAATAGAASVRMTHASGVADAAALAAADAASGAVTGIPCERAAQVADRGRVTLTACTVSDLVVTIEVAAALGPFTARARARAGPAA